MACYDVNNCRRRLNFIPVGGQVAMWSRGREYMRKWGQTMPKTSQKPQRAIFLANLRPWLAWHKKQKMIPNCGSICLSFQQFAGMLSDLVWLILSGFILCSWKALGPPSTVPGCQKHGLQMPRQRQKLSRPAVLASKTCWRWAASNLDAPHLQKADVVVCCDVVVVWCCLVTREAWTQMRLLWLRFFELSRT